MAAAIVAVTCTATLLAHTAQTSPFRAAVAGSVGSAADASMVDKATGHRREACTDRLALPREASIRPAQAESYRRQRCRASWPGSSAPRVASPPAHLGSHRTWSASRTATPCADRPTSCRRADANRSSVSRLAPPLPHGTGSDRPGPPTAGTHTREREQTPAPTCWLTLQPEPRRRRRRPARRPSRHRQ